MIKALNEESGDDIDKFNWFTTTASIFYIALRSKYLLWWPWISRKKRLPFWLKINHVYGFSTWWSREKIYKIYLILLWHKGSYILQFWCNFHASYDWCKYLCELDSKRKEFVFNCIYIQAVLLLLVLTTKGNMSLSHFLPFRPQPQFKNSRIFLFYTLEQKSHNHV